MKNILFYSQFFYPDIQATSQIFTDLCEDLAGEFKVRVICGFPLICAYCADALAVSRSEEYRGIQIQRQCCTRLKKKSLRDRFFNHISFSVFSLWALLKASFRTDIFIFTSDNPLNCLAALLFWGRPKIFICQDIYLEQGREVGFLRNRVLMRLLLILQHVSLRLADRIIVISKGMQDYLLELRIEPKKVRLIYNWADTEKIRPFAQRNLFSQGNGIADKFVVMYSGRIGLTQDFDMIVECAALMRNYPDAVFVIIGEGARKDALQELVKQKRLSNIVFLPFQPREALHEVYAASSISVIVEKPGLSRFLAPSKLYAIMASGRPVVACIDAKSEVCDIIRAAGCGIIVAPGDVLGFKDAITRIFEERHLISDLGSRGRKYVENYFSRTVMTDRYRQAILEMTKND